MHNPSLHPIAARWAAPGELFVRRIPRSYAARMGRGHLVARGSSSCRRHPDSVSADLPLHGNGTDLLWSPAREAVSVGGHSDRSGINSVFRGSANRGPSRADDLLFGNRSGFRRLLAPTPGRFLEYAY